MNQEQPKQYTPEEIAEMEKSRTISDAELLKGGAGYVIDEDEGKKLVANSEMIKEIRDEHENEEEKKIGYGKWLAFQKILEEKGIEYQNTIRVPYLDKNGVIRMVEGKLTTPIVRGINVKVRLTPFKVDGFPIPDDKLPNVQEPARVDYDQILIPLEKINPEMIKKV